MEKKVWIVGFGGSDYDGVTLRRFYGTKEEMKQSLVDECKSQRDFWESPKRLAGLSPFFIEW